MALLSSGPEDICDPGLCRAGRWQVALGGTFTFLLLLGCFTLTGVHTLIHSSATVSELLHVLLTLVDSIFLRIFPPMFIRDTAVGFSFLTCL